MSSQRLEYDLFWAYGPTSIEGWRKQPNQLGAAIDELVGVLQADRTPLLFKALYQTHLGKTQSNRQSKYASGLSMEKAVNSIGAQIDQCHLYIYDESFGPGQEPEVLVNVHLLKESAAGVRLLRLPDGEIAHSFLLCGVTVLLSRNIAFEQAARRACSALGLNFAYLFRGVGYEYDGKTPLEWAYKNHAAQLKSGKLEELSNLSKGVPLAVR